MIRAQLGKHNRIEKGRSAWDAFYDTTPQTVTSNQQLFSWQLVTGFSIKSDESSPQTCTTLLNNLNINLLYAYILSLQNCLFIKYSYLNIVGISFISTACYMTNLSHFLRLDLLNYIRRRLQVMKLLIVHFSAPHIVLPPAGSNILRSTNL
jgi:hypothetical protein